MKRLLGLARTSLWRSPVAPSVALFVAVFFVAALSHARPGGGQSHSGGGSSGGSSGGGSSGDGGALVELLIWLCFEHPIIGIPLLILFIIVSIAKAKADKASKGWATTGQAEVRAVEQVTRAARVPRSALDSLREIDPEFSLVLFEDFVYTLYAELERGRAGHMESLAPFVAPTVAGSLRADPNLADVRGIVIAAMRVVAFSGVRAENVAVELEFEASYSEIARQGGERRYYVVDRLSLHRARTARSRPFARARTLDCPNCGAPLSAARGTQCSYCSSDVGGGRFDWHVDAFRTLSKEPRGPLLTSDVEEVGTDQPTLVDPGAAARLSALERRDPTFSWRAFEQRTAHIWGELQLGWSGRDPARIRPYSSDNLLQSMMYWIDLYAQARCRNVGDNARILRIDLANVLSDKHYDAITVRLFAQSADYTIGDDGRLRSGSRTRVRTYSEYWTLIRGAEHKGQPKGDANCPNCGAPLKIDQVGNCGYCRVKVTSGEFDWVLSRIEQDESYTG